jgi:hypothetical protein
LALECAYDRHGSRAEYLLSMALTILEKTQSFDRTIKKIDNLISLMRDNRSMDIVPLTIHVNYCDEKIEAMNNQGLWLLKKEGSQEQCRNFNITDTFYGKLNWLKEILAAKEEYLSLIFPNNTVIKNRHRPHVFLVVSNTTIRPFENGEQFVAAGFEWNQIKTLKTLYSFFLNYDIGPIL